MSCKFKDTKSIKPKCILTQSECQFTKDAEECNDQTCDIKAAFADQEVES